MVDYAQYQDLSRKNILSMLISVSEKQCKDANCIADLEQLYIGCFLSNEVFPDSEKELYFLGLEKLRDNQIRVDHFVHPDSTVSKVLNIHYGNLHSYAGFYFKTGYQNLDELSYEAVKPFLARQK